MCTRTPQRIERHDVFDSHIRVLPWSRSVEHNNSDARIALLAQRAYEGGGWVAIFAGARAGKRQLSRRGRNRGRPFLRCLVCRWRSRFAGTRFYHQPFMCHRHGRRTTTQSQDEYRSHPSGSCAHCGMQTRRPELVKAPTRAVVSNAPAIDGDATQVLRKERCPILYPTHRNVRACSNYHS